MAALVYIVAALSVISWIIYRRLLPRPLPGIPYDPESASRISGDSPAIQASYHKHGEFTVHLAAQGRKLRSPLIQLFLSPLMPPWLHLEDPREMEDIVLRRNKEFDRSDVTSRVISTIMPHSTIVKKTSPHFRAQRRPWQDAMSPDFLKGVVAPRLYDAGVELIELWKVKVARAPPGKPVDIMHDFETAALDAIWAAILGESLGGLQDQITSFEKTKQDPDEPWTTGQAASGMDMQKALSMLNKAALGWRAFKFPSLQTWLLKQSAEFRHFDSLKNQQIERIMRASVRRFQDAVAQGVQAPDRCAMDLVLRREVQAAAKAGVPMRDLTRDVELRDEVFLLLWAGHDTTSNTLSWWTKYMARGQEVQDKLRGALRQAFGDGPGLPSVADIITSDIPYLDGVIEEAVRLAGTANILRQATVDTKILGMKVPKGTNIVFQNLMLSRPVPVPEEVRSATSRAAYEKRGSPGLDGVAGNRLAEFVPDRWLIMGESGKMKFDPYAIPRVGFGDGPRGCFGRKLAMHELRIMITLTTLSFKMLPLPEGLDNMKAFETMFRKPEDCYARFEPL